MKKIDLELLTKIQCYLKNPKCKYNIYYSYCYFCDSNSHVITTNTNIKKQLPYKKEKKSKFLYYGKIEQ